MSSDNLLANKLARTARTWRQLLVTPYTQVVACALVVASILAVGRLAVVRKSSEPYGVDESGLRIRPEALSSTSEKSQIASNRAVPQPATPLPDEKGEARAIQTTGPVIAQTASLTIVAADYDQASATIDRLAMSEGGYVQKLNAEAPAGTSRELFVTLRVPAKQLAALLAELRQLGHVEEESRANDEVTDQYVDLQARLKTSKASEQRLLELLGTRTGKLEDVLDVERELTRIREEIESMEGQRILLEHRVNYATIEIQLQEEYREKLPSESSGMKTKLWNATIEGLGNLEQGAMAILLFVLAYGPSILFWPAILLIPAWFVRRRFRSRLPLERNSGGYSSKEHRK